MNSKRHICKKCKYGHNYYKKKLPSNIRWCCKKSGLKKNVKNCEDFKDKKG